MKRRTFLLLLLLVLTPAARAQMPDPRAFLSPEERRELRERWQLAGPEERARMREEFQRQRALNQEQREFRRERNGPGQDMEGEERPLRPSFRRDPSGAAPEGGFGPGFGAGFERRRNEERPPDRPLERPRPNEEIRRPPQNFPAWPGAGPRPGLNPGPGGRRP